MHQTLMLINSTFKSVRVSHSRNLLLLFMLVQFNRYDEGNQLKRISKCLCQTSFSCLWHVFDCLWSAFDCIWRAFDYLWNAYDRPWRTFDTGLNDCLDIIYFNSWLKYIFISHLQLILS